MNPYQLANLIERTLCQYNLYSRDALGLLLGTAAVESRFGHYIKQTRGPALGIFQVEPATFHWLYDKYKVRFDLGEKTVEEMEWNLKTSILFARLRYLAVPSTLPSSRYRWNYIEKCGEYWKKNYNTYLGAGSIRGYLASYKEYVPSNLPYRFPEQQFKRSYL